MSSGRTLSDAMRHRPATATRDCAADHALQWTLLRRMLRGIGCDRGINHGYRMTPLQIVGRRSSHFTRIARIFAEELGLTYELVPVYDMTERDPAIYAGNPALKLPILRTEVGVVFGTENICRALADRAQGSLQIVWPEQLRRNMDSEPPCSARRMSSTCGRSQRRLGSRRWQHDAIQDIAGRRADRAHELGPAAFDGSVQHSSLRR